MVGHRGVVLVTGGSRGSGAEVSLELARRGYDLVVGYNNKSKHAERLAGSIAELALGTEIVIVGGNVADPQVRTTYVETATRLANDTETPWVGLVHMAAAGLDGTQEEARRVNAEAPFYLTGNFLVNLANSQASSTTTIYATSHPAHFWLDPSIPHLAGYEQVGQTKNSGEAGLRSLFAQEQAKSGRHRLMIASGDLVVDTMAAKLLARANGMKYEDFVRMRHEQLQVVLGRGAPTTEEYGQTIASMLDTQGLPSGYTAYVPRPVFEGCAISDTQLAISSPEFAVAQ